MYTLTACRLVMSRVHASCPVLAKFKPWPNRHTKVVVGLVVLTWSRPFCFCRCENRNQVRNRCPSSVIVQVFQVSMTSFCRKERYQAEHESNLTAGSLLFARRPYYISAAATVMRAASYACAAAVCKRNNAGPWVATWHTTSTIW